MGSEANEGQSITLIIGLDDLCVRFIVNLPREELESVERICFQVEEAQWFYEDFVRPLDPGLPSLSLKAFALRIFQHCPLMSQWSHYHHITAFSEFLAYKTRVPVRGAIMLNQNMDEVVLVKGWKKGANWSFPRGKINKDEKDLDCAIREVYEETGFDIRAAGLAPDENNAKFIEITMREQHMRLYVFRGVPVDTNFAPRTRKEISKIAWYKLSELPTLQKNKQQDAANANKFYMVAPFLHPLKKWIGQQRRLDARNRAASLSLLQTTEGETSMDEGYQASHRVLDPIQATGPSDLPEVTTREDVSNHLKRLLNVSGPTISPSTAQSSSLDALKSNALLELLRRGASAPSGQALAISEQHHPPVPVGKSLQLNVQPTPTLNPNTTADSITASSTGISNPSELSSHRTPTNIAFPHPAAGGTHHQFTDGSRQFPWNKLEQSPPAKQNPVMPTTSFSLPPYYQTGDPQFAQSSEVSKLGPSVPPASKLPPPKLTSHTLALLNVFKNQSSSLPKVVDSPTLGKAEAESSDRRKVTDPKDHLRYLLNTSTTAKAEPSAAAELSAQPVQIAQPIPKQILQRPTHLETTTRIPSLPGIPRPRGEILTSATVSGPLKVPNFANSKNLAKKLNGTPRNFPREPQTPNSPITILSRPSTARRDSPVSSEAASRAQSDVENPLSPEPTQRFQPKILRRTDKQDINSILPVRAAVNLEPSESIPSHMQGTQQGTQSSIASFDRHPSQTAAQKEALLSLFGKPSAFKDPRSVRDHSLNISTTTAPLISNMDTPLRVSAPEEASSPVIQPLEQSGGATISQLATERRVTSPGNKAFLLGFLEGVAKGSR